MEGTCIPAEEVCRGLDRRRMEERNLLAYVGGIVGLHAQGNPAASGSMVLARPLSRGDQPDGFRIHPLVGGLD